MGEKASLAQKVKSKSSMSYSHIKVSNIKLPEEESNTELCSG